MERTIFHIDVNSAYLSWEAVYRIYHLGGRLDLRKVPSAVGGDQSKRHGIILAKSIPAKKNGIHTGETIYSARQKCPDLIVVPANYDLYNRSSKAFIDILYRYSDKIEQYSIDEAYADMTGCCHDPIEKAHEIKDTISKELGFTVNVGVANNKLLAKMASDFKKPDRVHTLWQQEIIEKMWPLPVGDLFYVGHASERKLKAMGINTIGDLANADVCMLRSALHSHGLLIRQYANGIDDSELITEPPPNKGYGNSLTTPKDVDDRMIAERYLLSLAETVSARLRNDKVRAGLIAVSIRDFRFSGCSMQMALPEPTDLTLEIHAYACQILSRLWDGTPLRQIGIHTGKIVKSGARQYGMFDHFDYEKQKRAEAAVDGLRRRYGIDCIMRASFMADIEGQGENGDGGYTIDHMGGGVSREKWSVDYSKETIM